MSFIHDLVYKPTPREFFRQLFGAALETGGQRYIELRQIREGSVMPAWFPSVREFLEFLNEMTQPRNSAWYYGVHPRNRERGTSEDVSRVTSLHADLDFKRQSYDFLVASLKAFQHPPTAVVMTGNGLHPYWFLKDPEPIEDLEARLRFESIQAGVQAHLGGDKTHDLARILRIPGSLNYKTDPPKQAELLFADYSRRYTVSDFEKFRGSNPGSNPGRAPAPEAPDIIPDGQRNNVLTSMGGSMRRRGMDDQAIAAALLIENSKRCRPPLPDHEVHAVAKSVCRYQAPATGDAVTKDTWPALPPEALHGLAGQYARIVEPHTESDPVALLVQFLAATGSVIGRGAHWEVEADRHHLNLYAVLVGESAKGRKGTALSRIRRALQPVDEDWAKNRVQYGLSSGEGLIWAVRDPIEETKPVRVKGRFSGEYETTIVDSGIEDKRLLVVESEFASVLKLLQREGNTLSPVIRNAWDSGDLRTMTKNSPARVTGAHISIVGHITRGELLRYLDSTEAGNGFANRFLWVCVRRSKTLPEGGKSGRGAIDADHRKIAGSDRLRPAGGRIAPGREGPGDLVQRVSRPLPRAARPTGQRHRQV